MKGVLAFLAIAAGALAHDVGELPANRESLREHLLHEWGKKLRLVSTRPMSVSAPRLPEAVKAFQPFPKLELTWDGDYLYVGSNGLPDHLMMVGITNWQQQIPLPQRYFGSNAWRIPLTPVRAEKAAMIEGRFLRGAIALAVNGVPIFNPQNNRGEVSAAIGELDQWGGHCGRADDYHYHVAPLHLQTVVARGMPIAYALDGYPIYGITEPDGSAVGKLDECRGHEWGGSGYHYHASESFPYLMAGFRGKVAEVEGQVDPQPRAQPVRQALPPLRGAEITAFESLSGNRYRLRYRMAGLTRSITYGVAADGVVSLQSDDGSGRVLSEVYRLGGDNNGSGPPQRRSRGKREAKLPPPP
jgi:hypothetical protein